MTQKIKVILMDISEKFGKEVFCDAKKFSVISDALFGFQNEEMR